jgi:hypothetical protein
MEGQLDRWVDSFAKFNNLFSNSGFVIFDSLEDSIIQTAIAKYELEGEIEAVKYLVDYFSSDEMEKKAPFFKFIEPFKSRFRFIEFALADQKAGRFYSAIPLLLMVIDGVMADFSNRGFHSTSVDLDVWDSLTTADGGIFKLKEIFQVSRKKTTSDLTQFPFRHGILHGRDLNYDNQETLARTWCLLFVIRDWVISKRNEKERRDKHEASLIPPSIGYSLKSITESKAKQKVLANWSPRKLAKEACSSPSTDPNDPECILVDFLEFWRKRNYGKMADLCSTILEPNKKKFAGEIASEYRGFDLIGYNLLEIKDEAPSISEIKLSINSNNSYEKTVRMIFEDCYGNPVTRGDSGGKWKVISWYLRK